ncbi:Aminopeptidase O [Nymphon striatum]|nr:Aminopeptidase O [Nymphon striatum]
MAELYDETSKNLPLLSNVDIFKVEHYFLKLKCNFDSRIFQSEVILLIDNLADCHLNNPNGKDELSNVEDSEEIYLILDSKDIAVSNVYELELDDGIVEKRIDSECITLFELLGTPLQFEVQPWCIKIWKKDLKYQKLFPKCIKIKYVTKPCGSSTTWVNDQNENLCVFTQGAWINNRSLFPCQEAPVAMATWQAWILVPDKAKVVMSGDVNPKIWAKDGLFIHYYYTKMKLPMSTLALAIGFWDEIEIQSKPYPMRMYGPSPKLECFFNEYGNYLPECLKAAVLLLGPFPFQKLDFLILPRCFCSLGLASPNIIFCSQSLLSGDGSMKIKLAHEIGHSWFGLLIGALDWTEEWLSEGFATFVEDFIHSKTLKIQLPEISELSEIRAYLKFRNLSAELNNSDVDLQILRPCHGEDADCSSLGYIKNGMNPDKCFTQLHYIKGFFLLHHLYNKVGHDTFFDFLKHYIEEFSGKLVLSDEVTDFFFNSVGSEFRTEGLKKMCREWLNSPGMPKELKDFKISSSNSLFQDVMKENLEFEQLVLLLELLLDLKKISWKILDDLNTVYRLDSSNAEVLHRWCELIIKHKYNQKYDIISRFLQEHQAMGIYLYGEAIISSDADLQQLALMSFKLLKNEMDQSVRISVSEMFGDRINN